MTEWVRYEHPHAGFALEVPAGWETAEEVLGCAVVVRAPPNAEEGLVALARETDMNIGSSYGTAEPVEGVCPAMGYRVLADVVLTVHFAFVVFVAVGGLLAWRWPRLLRLHLPSVAWGAAIVLIGFTCPLTPLERELRERAGEGRFEESFVERYFEGVVYPSGYTTQMRLLAAGAIVVGWTGLLLRWRRRREHPRARGAAHRSTLTAGR